MIEQLQHDEGNRLISIGDSDYEYDDNGNQLGVDSAGSSGFLSTYINGEKWNLRMSVREEGIPWTSYSYALDGRRVGKEIAWIENKPSTWENVHYLYDGQNVVYEFGKNHPTVRYTHPLACDGLVCGPTAYAFVDAPISVTVDGVKYYYLYDGLGSVTELIDEDENVVNRYRYTPFGESIVKIEGVFNPYQFTGRRYDQETGQYYYRARMYSPSQGRFLSQDPLGMVDGPNMYAYVRGDPVNARDPSGRQGVFTPGYGVEQTTIRVIVGAQYQAAYEAAYTICAGRYGAPLALPSWVLGITTPIAPSREFQRCIRDEISEMLAYRYGRAPLIMGGSGAGLIQAYVMM